jgi:hypothetical protein
MEVNFSHFIRALTNMRFIHTTTHICRSYVDEHFSCFMCERRENYLSNRIPKTVEFNVSYKTEGFVKNSNNFGKFKFEVK